MSESNQNNSVVLEWPTELRTPTEDGRLPLRIAGNLMKNIDEIIPTPPERIKKFFSLFADAYFLTDNRDHPKNVYMFQLLIKCDIERGSYGGGVLAGQEIDPHLAKLNEVQLLTYFALYQGIMDKLFPKWFADRVKY